MSTSHLEPAHANIPPYAQDRERTFESFRRWGYLQANLDPLGQYLLPLAVAELDDSSEDALEARRYYCGNVGAEFMHIADQRKRQWLEQRLESAPAAPDQQHVLDLLIKADLFEQVIQSRYMGTKRFSLEGVTALIPFLDTCLAQSAEHGAETSVIAMSHRGRLNVMVNTIGKFAADIFSKFEDVDPRSILGGGDVKYHVGATGDFVSLTGKKIKLHLVSNPSHLEAVDPVAMGRARAKQTPYGDVGRDSVLPIVIHGDAAFAGQGVWAETLNLGGVAGYNVGAASTSSSTT